MRVGQVLSSDGRRHLAGAVKRAAKFCKTTLGCAWPTDCRRQLTDHHNGGWQIDTASRYCGRCGASMGPGGAGEAGCAFCLGTSIPWGRIVRLGPYTDPLNRWIVAMKFAEAWAWAGWFGGALADGVDGAVHADKVGVCPVPMHWTRRVRRGYNQAQLMAATLAAGRGWPVLSLLKRTRYTPPQTAVPPSRRAANIRRSFAIEHVDLTGWHIWLVDDVKTTGSTLAACTRLLRRAGAARVDTAVAAVTEANLTVGHVRSASARAPHTAGRSQMPSQ